MIKICHVEGRRSERVVWLLEELGGIAYELDFVSGDVLGSLLKLEAAHEMRMTPIITDGDLTLVESAAILEYILNKYAKDLPLRPASDSPTFPLYLQFLHFAEGTAMSKIMIDWAAERVQEGAAKKQPGPKLPGLAGSRSGAERIAHFAENTLAKSRYFTGEAFTAADIMMTMPVKMAVKAAGKAAGKDGDLNNPDAEIYETWPNVKRFVTEVSARPAYQRTRKITMPNGPPAM